jgi:ATP phosphoribosyltransferase
MTRLLVAVPSKGRLNEGALAFFERIGAPLARNGGERDYRGGFLGLDGAQAVLLPAAEIALELARGGVHLGLTGLDLIAESVPDPEARLEPVAAPGFGQADVVVAAPRAWVDVETMADLEDVAAEIRRRLGRPMRVATKYPALTRRHFSAHGLSDYLIVDSLGATEAAPAAGAAEAIVDITTSGATLRANGLKPLSDGLILASEARLVASLEAPWPAETRAVARRLLRRIASADAARTVLEVKVAGLPDPASALAALGLAAAAPFGIGEPLVLHVPADGATGVVDGLIAAGAGLVTTARLEGVAVADESVAERLFARLP